MNLEKLKAELTRDEGRRLTAYRDTSKQLAGGLWTIGIGHLLGGSPRMSTITDDECDALYEYDVRVKGFEVVRRVLADDLPAGWEEANDVRMRALVNMAFNRGEGRMRESSTITPAIRAALRSDRTAEGKGYDREKWGAVAAAIKASPWAEQIGERAQRLAEMLEHGVES